MQTSLTATENNSCGVYRRGSFAFLCGAAVTGVLLGAMCFSLDSTAADRLSLFGADSIQSRAGMDNGGVMAGSLLGSTVFLLAMGAAGFCAIGQPFELALLILRGMGLGFTLAGTYSAVGRSGAVYAAGLLLPGAVISTMALAAAAREAISLSNIYLRRTLSRRQETGLADTVKLYGAKLLVTEAMLALAAGADTLCNYLFIGKLT